MAQQTSVWRNCFKIFRQFGETLIMVLIADISVILRQILVRLYFITVTGTEQLRITNTTLSPAAIFVEAPKWKTSLFRQFPALSVYDTLCAQANRSTRPSLIRWLAQRGRAFPLLLMYRLANHSSFFSSMFEKHSTHMKGFGRKLLSRPRHPGSAPVERCCSVVSERE